MPQYFDNDDTIESKKRMINFSVLGKDYSLISDNGVFSKNKADYGSLALLKVLLNEKLPNGNILDMGCGYGTIGLVLASNYHQSNFTLCDINLRACALARENVNSLKLENVKVVVSDQFSEISEQFDVIITNPPIRAGKKVIYSIFEQSYHHLKQNGRLYIVIRKDQGANTAQQFISSVFGNCSLLKRDKGFYIYNAIKENTENLGGLQ